MTQSDINVLRVGVWHGLVQTLDTFKRMNRILTHVTRKSPSKTQVGFINFAEGLRSLLIQHPLLFLALQWHAKGVGAWSVGRLDFSLESAVN